MLSAINQELHARPYVRLPGQAQVLHLSFAHDRAAPGTSGESPATLVQAFAMRATYEAPRHAIYASDLPGVGHLVLAWACHTGYTSFTLYLYGLKEALRPATPFSYDMVGLLPEGWLAARRNALLSALHLCLLPHLPAPEGAEPHAAYFDLRSLTGSSVMAGAGTVWTDFRLDEAGFSKMLLETRGMSRHEVGRTVQRLLGVEDMHHLVLMPLAVARETKASSDDDELRIAEVMRAISRAATTEEKRARLDELMALAVVVERDSTHLALHLAPAHAYYAMLLQAFKELREDKVPGVLSISTFVLRRVAPAVQTYTYLERRFEALSARLARAADLLRTAVELNVSEQNQLLLGRMDERAKLQLRLQETVEGLSIIAISYYTVGLLGYVFKGAKALGWHVQSDVAIALSVPVVVVSIWLGGRYLRHQLLGRGTDVSPAETDPRET